MATNAFIDTAKVIAKGKISIPRAVRDVLGVSTGDRATFIVEENSVYLVNSAVYAMYTLQQEMAGEADRTGLISEDDVMELIQDLRYDDKSCSL